MDKRPDDLENGIQYSDNISEPLSHADTFLLCDNVQVFSACAYQNILERLSKGPNDVLMSRQLYNCLEAKHLIGLEKITILENEYIMKKQYKTDELLSIDIPVIYVFGMGK